MLTGAAVLGLFFVVLWLGIAVLISLTMGHGELGSVKTDEAGAYERFEAADPVVIRVLTVTVDPALDLLDPGTDRIESAIASFTLPGELDMSIAAVRMEGDRFINLREEDRGRFRDDLPSSCLEARCSRTYVLVACWTTPSTGGALSTYVGGSVSAGPASETSPVQVMIRPDPTAISDQLLAEVAEESGCGGPA